MLLTEQEAKSKWCPMVRYNWNAPNNTAGINRNEGNLNNCIASRCMMWRGDYYKNGAGYCGLSGKPEVE